MNALQRFVSVLALAGAAGCAHLPPISEDMALCDEAVLQFRRGDPAYEQTLARIRDLQTAWYCHNYRMAWARGENPGGGGWR